MRPGAVLPALAVAAMVGCGDDGGPTPPDLPVPPGSLVILSGDAQTVLAGESFAGPVVVEVRDSAGDAFSDEPRDTTGPDGRVTFSWQPGAAAGVHRLRAGVDAGSSHTCGLTADGLYCWGDNGTGQIGVRFPEPAGPSLVTGQGQ